MNKTLMNKTFKVAELYICNHVDLLATLLSETIRGCIGTFGQYQLCLKLFSMSMVFYGQLNINTF